MKRLKFVLFIAASLVALGIINLAFVRLLNWTIDRTDQWYNQLHIIYFVLLIPLFWGVIWGIFKLSAIGMAALLVPVSPDKKKSLYILGIFSLLNCLALIIHYWVRDVDYSWKVILMTLIITAFIIDFSASIVMVFSRTAIKE
jgi:uncharacterized membrane protein